MVDISRLKLLIIGGGILFLVFLALIFGSFFAQRNTQPGETETGPGTSTSPGTGTGSLPIAEPEFLGEKEISITQKEHDQIEQASELRSRLPLEMDGFSINYDYGQDHFVVTLSSPYQQNEQQFRAWILRQGYGAIPLQRFVIQRV